jgi:hypothetical protein
MRVTNCIAAVAVMTLAAVLAGAAAIESAQTVVVTDPAGDVKNKAEPWQDIVSGRVAREGTTFTLSMEMAGALPAKPPGAPGGLGWYYWEWGIDTDPDLAPDGWPFPDSQGTTHDFMVGFVADGEEYFAFIADRRPMAIGLEPVFTEIPYRVDGARIDVFVDAGLLDDPAEFRWRVGTINFHPHLETHGFQLIDRFDGGYAHWPQN